jgi:hypothetical protein
MKTYTLLANLNDNFSQTLSSFAPCYFTINPATIPSIYIPNKISKIVYNWGDGVIEEQIYKPSSFSKIYASGVIEDGDPRKFQKTHSYSLSNQLFRFFRPRITIHQFSTSAVYEYRFLLRIVAPQMDARTDSYFKSVHLIDAKMFDKDNKILYIFEGKNPFQMLPVVVDWQRNLKDSTVTEGDDYRVFNLN